MQYLPPGLVVDRTLWSQRDLHNFQLRSSMTNVTWRRSYVRASVADTEGQTDELQRKIQDQSCRCRKLFCLETIAAGQIVQRVPEHPGVGRSK